MSKIIVPGAQEDYVQSANSSILRLVTTVDCPAVSRYSLRETLKAGTVVDGIKVAHVDADIFTVFGDLVETDVPTATLRVSEFTQTSTDPQIIAELGGEDVTITTWAHDWEIMKLQGQGKSGPLRTDGWTNLSYKRAPDRKVWVLDRTLLGGGWGFYLYLSSGPCEWYEGDRVVSG